MRLPQNIREKIPKRTKGSNPMVHAKFFNPFSGWTWFIMSIQGKAPYTRAYCFVDGFCREFGDVYLEEIEAQAEFDRGFTPKRLSELKEGVDY